MVTDRILTRVGNNIRRIRREQGLTIEQLSFASAVNKSYISDLERGVRNPTIVMLDRIAVALDIDVSELVNDPLKKKKTLF